MAFKIRTTQPLCFVVKPNSGIIEAGATASIEINYVPNEVNILDLMQAIKNTLTHHFCLFVTQRVLNAAESKF